MNKHKRYIPKHKKRPAKRRSQSCLPTVLETMPTITELQLSEAQLVSHDKHLLERSRTQWQFGDWESLAQLSPEAIQHHPDKAKLALLAASGQLQTGENDKARTLVRLAQEWGCSKKLVSQTLIAGVYNSLGKAAAVGGQEQRALGHFEKAVVTGMPGSDVRLLAQVRTNKQLQQLHQRSNPCQQAHSAKISDIAPVESTVLNTESSVYQFYCSIRLDNANATRLGFTANVKGGVKAVADTVEYQSDKDAPVYLVSNEHGEFQKPPYAPQVVLKPNTAYQISGDINHSGANRPIIWIFQYAQGQKIVGQSVPTESGCFQLDFSTKPEMDSFAIGIRLVGTGYIDYENSFISLREISAEDITRQFEEKIEKLKLAQKREVESSMKQIESFIRLQHYLGSDMVLPDMHNWAISPDFGMLLVNMLEQNDYDAVIEFGTGTSTLILAKALERVGHRDGKAPAPLVSFDHLEEYSHKTQQLLKRAKLTQHTRVVHAPLNDWQDSEGNVFPFYSCDEDLIKLRQLLPESNLRVLVIVDGPPASTGKHARYPAMPMVLKVFSPDKCLIQFLLDDYLRTDEQEIAVRWCEELKELRVPVSLTEFNNLEKKACLMEAA